MPDYTIGSVVRVLIDQPTDQDGTLVTPDAVQVSVKRPDAATDGPFSAVLDSFLGVYGYSYVPPIAGEYTWRAVITGAGQGAVEGSFYVYPQFSVETDAWKPALLDVAGLVPTRTIDANGTQQNTFTATTTPTDTQVTGFISRIIAEIHGVVGEVPSAQFEQAKHTATLGVAWLVERTFPPTQDVQNVANDFVNDYRASLRLLASSVSTTGEAGARAVSVSLGSYTWPTT